MTGASRGDSSASKVRKAAGDWEPFSTKKLYRSLRSSGADKTVAQRVVNSIRSEWRNGSSTRELGQLAVEYLSRESKELAARYSLKNALFELGPAGYPFERFVARLLEAQGAWTEVNVILDGKCVAHEIDVIAMNDGERDLIECKFRTGSGTRCDVKVALYVHARSLDLRASSRTPDFRRFRLITNTKFTGDAIRYAECVGLDLLGWDYPKGNALPQQVERLNLHPLTCLTTLTTEQKTQLLGQGTLLCSDLDSDPTRLDRLQLEDRNRSDIEAEIAALLRTSSEEE